MSQKFHEKVRNGNGPEIDEPEIDEPEIVVVVLLDGDDNDDEIAAGPGISGEFTIHTTVHTIIAEGNVYVGQTECGDNDDFNKVRGSYIAKGRAEKVMAVSLGLIPMPIDTELVKITVVSRDNESFEGVTLVSTVTPEEAKARLEAAYQKTKISHLVEKIAGLGSEHIPDLIAELSKHQADVERAAETL